MDISETLTPKSDQLNAEDLLAGPRTVTVENVAKGSVEQPVDIHLVEFPGRPFKPSKTVRRLLVAVWGSEASNYVGRRMTLYRDPAVKFGGMDVGGIRLSAVSHIDKPVTIALTVTRGKRAPFTVAVLHDDPAPTTAGMSEANRTKWLASMTAALTESGTTVHADQLTVITSILKLDQPPEQPDTITDDQLKTVVNTLNGWRKDGTLADMAGQILDNATIDAESNGDTK